MILFWSSCEKKPQKQDNNVTQEGRKALVVNEGSLGNGNASINLLNLKDYSIAYNIFEDANNQQSIGDILNYSTIINDQIFLAVTNSNVIRVLDKNTFKETQQITVPFPRYIYEIGNNLAYVSSYNSGKIFVINLQTYAIVDEITLPFPHVEKMLITNGKAYVCNWHKDNNELFVINTQNHTLSHQIELSGNAPHSIIQDKHEVIWVLGGNKNEQVNASITQIVNDTVKQSFQFAAQSEIIKPVYDQVDDMLYFINIDYTYTQEQGILKMAALSNAIPQDIFIKAQSFQYFYQIIIDPVTRHLFISDPKGFVQRSDLLEYDLNGQLLRTISTDIGTNNLLFL